MVDINGWEFVVILVVAAIVIGPQRLPQYAEQLAGWVRKGRVWLKDARSRLDEEMGDGSSDVDWAALDPRRYDPRRIVRDALLEPDAPRAAAPAAATMAAATAAAHRPAPAAGAPAPSGPAPYDDEAT